MTPDRILDLTMKFGVTPLLFYVVFITRQDNAEIKKDVKELQYLLIDCYQDKINVNQRSAHRDFPTPYHVFAVIPCDPVGKIRKA